MSALHTLEQPSSPAREALDRVLASWRGITRHQIVLTFLLGCALHLYRMAVTINIRYAPFIFVGDQIKVFGFLLAIAAADGITGKDPARRAVYLLAVFFATAIIWPVQILVIWGLIALFVDSSLKPPGGIGWALNNSLEVLMIGGATAWIINDRRRANNERDRMHAAELARVAAERRSVESNLQAMQARVEPQFLFNTLAQVKRAYAHNAALGKQLLDALIAYLRAAMPRMRDTSSTVGQELELVRAYLDIVHLRLADRLTFAIEPPDDGVPGARMPAMLVLPLVDHAIAHSVAEWHSAGSIRVRAAIVNQKIRFELSQTGVDDAAENDERILAIRERLAALYGGEASLVMQRLEPNRTKAVLEIPHQRAPMAVSDPTRSQITAREVV
jgi:hypothetical protein